MFHYINKRSITRKSPHEIEHVSKDSLDFVQRLSLWQTMDVHNGCVNTVVWNDSGQYLLSGSDDRHIVISDPFRNKDITKIYTAHRSNIFSAKFLPFSSDKKIISCAGDGKIIFTDLEKIQETKNCIFDCHRSSVYDVVTVPNDGSCFLSCGEDMTVRWFDLRDSNMCPKDKCNKNIMLQMGKAATAIALNPVKPYEVAVGTQDSVIRVYDRRKLIISRNTTLGYKAVLMRMRPDSLKGRQLRITCLRYDELGLQILASYSAAHLYLFDTQTCKTEKLNFFKERKDKDSVQAALKKLRFRGDWSDTGPNARPERMPNMYSGVSPIPSAFGQARPILQNSLMHRMSNMLSRMLSNNPPPSSQPTPPPPMPGSLPNPVSFGERSYPPHDVIAGPSRDPLANHSSVSLGGNDESIVYRDAMRSPPPNSLQNERDDFPRTNNSNRTFSAIDWSRDVMHSPPINNDELDIFERHSRARDVVQEPHTSGPCPIHDAIAGPSRDRDDMQEPPSDQPMDDFIPPPPPSTSGFRNSPSAQETSASGSGSSSVVPTVSQPQDGNSVPPVSEGPSLERDNSVESDTSAAMPSHQNESTSANQFSDFAQASSSRSTYDSSTLFSQSSSSTSFNPSSAPVPSRRRSEDTYDDQSFSDYQSYSDDQTFSNDASSDDDTDHHLMPLPLAPPNVPHSNQRKESVVKKVKTKIRLDGPYGSDMNQATHIKTYTGHRNSRTMIKEACFWGRDYIMSGSDCGRIFVWNRHTQKLVMLMEADRRVVNCLQPHPTLPILASSGIDYNIKLWSPIAEETSFDEAKADEIMQCNEVLLEETQGTITVPATFMLRILMGLNHLRRPRVDDQGNIEGDHPEEGEIAALPHSSSSDEDEIL